MHLELIVVNNNPNVSMIKKPYLKLVTNPGQARQVKGQKPLRLVVDNVNNWVDYSEINWTAKKITKKIEQQSMNEVSPAIAVIFILSAACFIHSFF